MVLGVTGWIDNRGRANVVPIRCGKILPDKLTLYAGAGLVDGSIRLRKKETDWKLQAMQVIGKNYASRIVNKRLTK